MGLDGEMAKFIMASSNEPYTNRVLTLNDYKEELKSKCSHFENQDDKTYKKSLFAKHRIRQFHKFKLGRLH